MALKALDIFKLLPKTNCKKCGCPTCLAFAMKMAQNQASLDACPDVSAASKAALAGAAAPPIRLVTVGAGDRRLEIGNETVMFRHDESFYRQPGVGVIIPDTLTGAALEAKLAKVRALSFHRVGMTMNSMIVAVDNASGKPDAFASAAKAVGALGLPVVLMTAEPAHAEAAIAAAGLSRPLLHAATAANVDAFAALAKAKSCPLAVAGPDLDAKNSRR